MLLLCLDAGIFGSLVRVIIPTRGGGTPIDSLLRHNGSELVSVFLRLHHRNARVGTVLIGLALESTSKEVGLGKSPNGAS